MTTRDENDQQRSSPRHDAPEEKGGKTRLLLLIGLLMLALFALWYDYKVARPAVERAYDQIAATNVEINSASEHRRMTSVDVQRVLDRTPSETFISGKYTVEAYRWRAGMPIEFRGLTGDESPGIGLKTHDYYAVYRKDGPDLAFVTHYKFDLDPTELDDTRRVVETGGEAPPDEGPAPMGGPGMAAGPGGPGGGGPGLPGGGGVFDPEIIFSERDADGNGLLSDEEISERLRGRLEAIDTNGDGSVSKEEFLAGFRARGGRAGGAGGPEGEGRRQRPPLETTNTAPPAPEPSVDESPNPESEDAPGDSTPETVPN